jgi:two-component system, NarL family, nitrate/nitrite response regulator NarL
VKRILLLDDHEMFRESLAHLLAEGYAFNVVAVPSVREALGILASQTVNLALIDFDLGDEVGLDFVDGAVRAGFTGPMLVLTAGVNGRQASRLAETPIRGIVLKHNPVARLVEAIRAVADGGEWWDMQVLSRMLQEANGPAPITERERTVLPLVIEGHSNKEIGGRLDLSESQVKSILQKLFHKTGTKTRAQLVRTALEKPHLLV